MWNERRAGDDPSPVLARLWALEQHGIKLGLHNIAALTDALGRPQTAWTAVHVAGTNGKGSVVAMVERALRAAGHRTGRYTSPHLHRIEERVAIDGAPVDAARFEAAAARVLAVADDLQRTGAMAAPPTFFEVTTAAAFDLFREGAVRVGVIEVGLGGRFDATNVLEPAVTAITSIGRDHEQYLGSTLERIAFEKAGIVKPSVPVVVGDLPPEAQAAIDAIARRRGAPMIRAGAALATDVTMRRGRATISVRTPAGRYDEVQLALNGAHQIANAVLAVGVLEACAGAGVHVEPHHIVVGLREAEWPARLEWLRVSPGRHLLLDAAHNADGARALAAYLEAAGVSPLPLVLAVMQDKDVNGIIGALLPVVSRVIATRAPSARSLGPAGLADAVRRRGVAVDTADTGEDAVRRALVDAAAAVCAGSIYLVGPLRARLVGEGARPGVDPP